MSLGFALWCQCEMVVPGQGQRNCATPGVQSTDSGAGDPSTFHWSCFPPSRTEQLHLLLSTFGIKDLLYFQDQLKSKAETEVNVGVQIKIQTAQQPPARTWGKLPKPCRNPGSEAGVLLAQLSG